MNKDVGKYSYDNQEVLIIYALPLFRFLPSFGRCELGAYYPRDINVNINAVDTCLGVRIALVLHSYCARITLVLHSQQITWLSIVGIDGIGDERLRHLRGVRLQKRALARPSVLPPKFF